MQISPDDDSAASTSPFTQSMLGDVMTVDIDLDYRVDVAYAGSLIKDTSRPWSGELNRLTTPCSADPCSTTMWGIAGSLASNRIPTKLISTIGSPGPKIGPVTAGVTVTKDDSNNVWVFFGTGRFYDYSDKTLSEQEYFLGIKDSVQTGCSQTSRWACQDNVLVDVSSASICSGTVCTGNQVTGVTDGSSTPTTLLGTTTSSLQGLVASKKGWFTKLPKTDPAAPRERVLVSPTLFGGMVFFPTFVPQDDLCVALGDGYLYSLFYQTGSAYKDSVIGTDATTGIVNKSISLGQGQVSQLGVHIGAEGRDANGTNNGGGCQGGTSVIGQSSTGAIGSTCVKTQSVWSRYLSWNNQRL
jgi:type IV pilus assembly protein PilY1